MLAREPNDFVSRHLFDNVPFIFDGDFSSWITWRASLAGMLEVDPREVVLTGSACVGFSLSPDKNFRAFDHTSDVDVGVISAYHFDQAWRHLRQQRVSWMLIDRRTRQAIEQHRKNYVFAGTIATDRMLGILPFGKNWQAALDLMGEQAPTKGREIKLRIYRDYDALRYYQASSIRGLQAKISAPEIADEQPIPEED